MPPFDWISLQDLPGFSLLPTWKTKTRECEYKKIIEKGETKNQHWQYIVKKRAIEYLGIMPKSYACSQDGMKGAFYMLGKSVFVEKAQSTGTMECGYHMNHLNLTLKDNNNQLLIYNCVLIYILFTLSEEGWRLNRNVAKF